MRVRITASETTPAKRRRWRLIALMGMASALSCYLATLQWGAGVLVASVLGLLMLIALVRLAMALSRKRQLSMRTFVFVLPVLVAVGALAAHELSQGRRQKAILARAAVEGEAFYDDPRGAIQQLLQQSLGPAYRHTLALDIRQLYVQPQTSKCSELKALPVERLQEVHMIMVSGNQPIPKTTIQWLNQLPASVQLKLTTLGLSEADASMLNQLSRPLNKVFVRGGTLSQKQLQLALTLPTRELALHQAAVEIPAAMEMSPSHSQTLDVSGLPSSFVVKLARWKGCSKLGLFQEDLSLDDCAELANLPHLKVLHVHNPIELDRLCVLLESKHLQSLQVTVSEALATEAQNLRNSKPGGPKLTVVKWRSR